VPAAPFAKLPFAKRRGPHGQGGRFDAAQRPHRGMSARIVADGRFRAVGDDAMERFKEAMRQAAKAR